MPGEALSALDSRLAEPSAAKASVFGLAFVCQTSTGQRLFADVLHSGKFRKKGLFSKCLAAFWKKCRFLLEAPVCLDEFHTDQVLLYCCLAKGVSRLKTGKLSLHSRAVIELARTFLDALVDVAACEDGTCELTIRGVGFERD